jgi:universal stress protein A
MIARFQRILLPVDFTPKNESAVEVAKELATQYDATIAFIHVIETINLPEDDELRAFYAQLEKRARSAISAMASRIDTAKTPVDEEVCFGHCAEEIVRFADQQKIDLIVMSSHRVDPQQPVHSWNTLSYQVSLLCTCPILLVK